MKFNNETIRTAVKEYFEDSKKAEEKYGHISNWDVSGVTDMSKLFSFSLYFHHDSLPYKRREEFNEDISNWVVSKVTDMSEMFEGVDLFNQEIGKWDVSSVTNLSGMFGWTESFNKDIGNWDVSKVTDMSNMFRLARSFNQDIGSWDVSNVTDMSGMFEGHYKEDEFSPFNQDIGGWDVSNVTNMHSMFYRTESFNQDIGGWNVGNVTDMRMMFCEAIKFNQNLKKWEVCNDTDVSEMFDFTKSFKQDTNDWEWLNSEENEKSSGSINLDIEITPTKIQKLKKGSKCTVFLTNSKEHLLVIFKATYDEDYIDEVLDPTGAKDIIDGYDTIVNLTEDESVDLKEYPPVLIKCSSQSVLNNLHHYMPEKKFVLVYSWDLPEKHDVGEYDDYLDSLWYSSQQKETSEYANNDGKVEVVNKLLRVYVTDENVTENEPGLQIVNFPSSSKSMQFASECGCGHNFEYDDLIVFEKEVFDNLEIKKVYGQIEWEGDSFPIAPILNLEVEKYKSKVILEY